MTGNGKAVSHEAALMEYAIRKARAEFVTSHGLKADPVLMFDLEASEILTEFRQHRDNYQRHTCGRPLGNPILRFELCPTSEETQGWTREDHANLVREFISILDSLTSATTKKGTFRTPRTSVGNTQWVAMLHHDGANGCDHIHLLANRIDRDGNTIPDSYLQAKAEMAANIINQRRGWKQSMVIGLEHREQMRSICMDILREMPQWDWNDYFRRLEAKGFEHFCRTDSKTNEPRGYCIFWGNSSIPASEIDRGLTWSRIEDTWQRLQYQQRQAAEQRLVNYDFSFLPNFRNKHGGTVLAIKESVNDVLHGEIKLPDPSEYKNEMVEYQAPAIEDIAHVAVALFFGYIDAATTIVESHGGSGGDTSSWGQDPKEKDEDWMRRCARMASRLCRPPHHPRVRRGLRR